MQKILIAAGDLTTGETFQKGLSHDGFQTAVVWNSVQMMDFCRQNSPDVAVVDLDLGGPALWNSLQAIRGIGALANMPVIGLSSTGDPAEAQQAQQAGISIVLTKQEALHQLGAAIRSIFNSSPSTVAAEMAPSHLATRTEPEQIQQTNHPHTAMAEQQAQMGTTAAATDGSINRLRLLANESLQITQALKPKVVEYGADGPELFGYIEGSAGDITNKLGEIDDEALQDHELRHDFRNMIGSVTGFAELILMEPGLSPDSQNGLSRLRECSREFVDILDKQKAMAS